MRRTIELGVASVLALGLLVGCKERPRPKKRAKKSRTRVIVEGPGSSADQPVTLENAIASGWVEVRLRSVNDTYDRASLILKPLVRTKPWLRIRPIWRIANTEESGSADMVLIAGGIVRLYAKNNRLVSLPNVQTHPTYKRNGRKGARFEQLDEEDDEALLKLLAETGRRHAGLAKNKRARFKLWGTAQMAVWLQQADVPIDTLRRTEYGVSRHAGYTLYSYRGVRRLVRTGEDLKQVFELLEAADIPITTLRAHREWQGYGGVLPPLGKRRRPRRQHRRRRRRR